MSFAVLLFVCLGSSFVQAGNLSETLPTEPVSEPVENVSSSPLQEVLPKDGIDVADAQNGEDEGLGYRPICKPGVGYLRDPKDCGRFYQCSNGIAYRMTCPSGLYFDIKAKVCNWPHLVQCGLDRCDRRRVGRLSGSASNAISTARCPKGYVPVGCASSDPRRSDGNSVSGRDCVAVNGYFGNGQRAIATCVSVDDGDYEYVTSTDGRNPTARCRNGYRVINCLMKNAWAHIRYAFPQLDASRNSCSSDITCWLWACSVQAVCRRRNQI